jgi:hypothetical protein
MDLRWTVPLSPVQCRPLPRCPRGAAAVVGVCNAALTGCLCPDALVRCRSPAHVQEREVTADAR